MLDRCAAMSIPPYEPPRSAPSQGVGNTLLCPQCAGVMKTYELLDFGELEALTQMENQFVQAAPVSAAGATRLRLRPGLGRRTIATSPSTTMSAPERVCTS